MGYDGSGNVTGVTDPLNGTLQMTWNARHQPLTVRDKRGNVTTNVYDASGYLISSTDPLAKTWTYTYDARGNKLTETNPLNQTTTYTYDLGNRVLTKTDGLAHTWTWTYNAAGQMLTAKDPLNNTETFVYDALGQLTSYTDQNLKVWTLGYNVLGALTSITDPLGRVTTYAYDTRGLNTTKTDPAGKVTTYTWDISRRLSTVTDSLGRTTTYGYDSASRLATITNPLSQVTTYTYDAAGRLASEKDPLNRTTSYLYDTEGKLTRTTAPNTGQTNYTYDLDGNLLTVSDPLGHVTTYTYDGVSNRLTSKDPLLNQTTYGYDGARRLVTVTNPLNQVTTYAYDAAGRTTSVQNALGQTTTYGYDNANRRTTVTDPLGRVTTAGYDAVGRVTTVTTPAGTTTNLYDAAGQLTKVTRPSGAFTQYAYDARGLLTSATIPTQGTTTYSYDANGNRLTKVNGGTTTNYTYDDADQLTLEGTTSYTYDTAGNLTARGTSTYTYDWRGRMTSSTVGGTTTSYTYDGTDVRTAKQTGATTTTYLWDRESGLPLLIDDGTNGYVHQGTGNPLTQTTLAGGISKWLLTDALGSVRGAADAAGALTGSANYDVFGAPYGTDSTGSKLGFTGEQRDAETGFGYLRARYYNPSNGRFTSRDSLYPAGEGTQGYNRYVYGSNNPTTWTDPSGRVVAAAAVAASPLDPFFASTALRVAMMAPAYGAMIARALWEYREPLSIVAAVGLIVAACWLDICPRLVEWVRVTAESVIADAQWKVRTTGARTRPEEQLSLAEVGVAGAAGVGVAVATGVGRCLNDPSNKTSRVYLGFDRRTNELVYVGHTHLTLSERERLHNSQGNDIRLVEVISGISRPAARGIEQMLATELELAGYNLRVNLQDPVGLGNVCWPVYMAEASKYATIVHLRVTMILFQERAKPRFPPRLFSMAAPSRETVVPLMSATVPGRRQNLGQSATFDTSSLTRGGARWQVA